MNTTLSRINQVNPFKYATLFTLVMMLPLPILLFSSRFPTWLPWVVIGFLVTVFLLRGLANGRLLGHTAADFPLYLLLLLIPLNLWASPQKETTLSLIYILIANLALFWALAAQRDAKWLQFTPWLYSLAVLGLTAFTLIGTDFSAAQLPFVPAQVYDQLSTVDAITINLTLFDADGFNPNLSAGLLALFVLPLFVTAWQGKGWLLRLTSAITMTLALILIVLLISWGALIGLAAALVAVTVVTNKRWLIFWLITAVVSLLALYFLVPMSALETLFSGGVPTISGLASRQEIWGRVFYLLEDFPISGVGLGMVEHVINVLYPTFVVTADSVNHAHNLYLQAGAEMGLLGMVATIAFLLILLGWLLKTAHNTKKSPNAILALGLLGSLVTYMVHGLVETITSSPLVAIVVWGWFGLMAAVAATATIDSKTPTD